MLWKIETGSKRIVKTEKTWPNKKEDKSKGEKRETTNTF